jgi:hypothetical protein
MSSNDDMKDSIQEVIKTLMDRVMDRVLVTDPFLADEHHAKKPLYAFLVPDEIFKGSHFERRFVTPFGGAWEKLALVAGNAGGGKAEPQHAIRGNINAERLRRIQEILNKLEHRTRGQAGPDWAEELKYVHAGESEELIPTTVLADIYLEKGNEKFAFELKAPLPNSDQTKVSKEKILKLYAMEPVLVSGAFYALPYNPYGSKKEDYAWTFPARWFDMKNDPVVLIGDEFWDKIGGTGTYNAFLEAVNEMGGEYKERIYREYLGIEPPEHS